MDIRNKKINFLGDSITEGHGCADRENNCFVARIARDCGAVCRNYGIGGTRIARQAHPSENPKHDLDFVGRYDDMDPDADIVVVFGGTNDYGHGKAKFGDLKDKGEYTFCGAVNLISDMLAEKFGKDKLCFILPCARIDEEKNEHGKTLKDYVDAIKNIIGGKGIDVLDFYKGAFPKPTTDKGDEYTADGLHPNDRGHELLADKIIAYLKNKKLI